ncbi:hypothetical protein J1614_001547 [Plenodomus biglobosus]|nr:hypothetical protein J1614_001547 [Plenodomus biglobosus]
MGIARMRLISRADVVASHSKVFRSTPLFKENGPHSAQDELLINLDHTVNILRSTAWIENLAMYTARCSGQRVSWALFSFNIV